MISVLRIENQRKFTSFMTVFLGCLVALFFDKLPAEYFEGIIVPAFGLFMAGNAAEHWKPSKRSKEKSDGN